MAFKRQYHGIKFPFTSNNDDGLFIDLNANSNENICSQIAHIILTPKNTRVRMPDFGTDLIKYIFSMNDEMEWENVQEEIIGSVNKYLNGASITNVKIIRNENDDNSVFVSIDYAVKKGEVTEANKMMIKI